jgi:hypothetical protein
MPLKATLALDFSDGELMVNVVLKDAGTLGAKTTPAEQLDSGSRAPVQLLATRLNGNPGTILIELRLAPPVLVI